MFTDPQKSQIRQVTGRSDRFKDIDTTLESMMDALSPAAEAQVVALLGQVTQIDGALLGAALNNLDARKIKSVELLGPEQLRELRRIGRQFILQICIVFEVDPLRDYYGDPAPMGGEIELG